MKLTIVTKNISNWHVQQILKSAKKHGLEAEAVTITSVSNLTKKVNQFGELVYWRSSGIDNRSERAVFERVLEDRYVINGTVFKTPFVTHKLYQQKKIKAFGRMSAITTYHCKSLEELSSLIHKNRLRYPFIAKPNVGGTGRGVLLIKNESELSQLTAVFAQSKDYIFQNFIRNNGDWRVMVLGGKPLGVIYRMAKPGGYLNNISKGGSSRVETDPAIIKTVSNMAVNAAATLDLVFCGVDIIRDEESGEFFFLETNSVPQWDSAEGFQAKTGVNVADEMVKFFMEIAQRSTKPLPQLVREYYDTHFDSLDSKAIHYASRLYLWSGDTWAKRQLDIAKNDYLGDTNEATEKKLRGYLENKLDVGYTSINYRKEYYQKYEALRRYNKILFKVLLAETIYGIDLRPIVRKLAIDDDMVKQFKLLVKDEDAIRILSTHAVNYMYLVKNYFKDNKSYQIKVNFNPNKFIHLLDDFDKVAQTRGIPKEKALTLKIYMLTHAIIGESLFYAQAVDSPIYQEMIQLLEELISKNYFICTLDNKFEFLVCAALCNYSSHLKPVIHDEANNSLSNQGNFVVDTFNKSMDRKVNNRLSQAEHRNVLYLMSTIPFGKQAKTFLSSNAKQKRKAKNKLATIGRKAIVDFPKLDLFELEARVDSGAYFSAIHCKDIVIINDSITFSLLDPEHPKYNNRSITLDKYSVVPVKNSSGVFQDRYLVDLEVNLNGKTYIESFTLADRSAMMFPVLLGRTFLKNKFVVDVSRLTVNN